jgi:large subunit ribosomal protein L28
MSRICQLTGKKAITGNNVSHSNKKTKRKFHANIKVKKFWVPEFNDWVVLRVSTSAIRNINKKGISVCIQEAINNGYLK